MYEQQNGTRISRLFMQDEWRPELFYHVIGKAIPGSTLFQDDKDCHWFLKHVLRFKLHHCFRILVYCLCGNHYHLAIQTRSESEIRNSLLTKPTSSYSPSDEAFLASEINYQKFISNTLSGAISGYTRRYNSRWNREGQLFIRPTLHGLTDKGGKFGQLFSRTLCGYVGFNYVKHHIATVEEFYKWSSLRKQLYQIVDHDYLLELFGGEKAYVDFHAKYLLKYGRAFHQFDEDLFFAALQPRRFDSAQAKWVEEEWRNDSQH